MIADTRFAEKPLEFWAYVRLISQRLGYYQKDVEEEGSDEPLAVLTIDEGGPESTTMRPETAPFVGRITLDAVARCLTSVRVTLGVKFNLAEIHFAGLSFDQATKSLILV